MKRELVFLLIPLFFIFDSSFGKDISGFTYKNYFEVIPYEVYNNKLIINVEINGIKRKFLFDTGASTLISKSLFAELNAAIIHKESDRDVFNNKVTIIIVSLDEIKLGNTILNDIPVTVADSTQDFFRCGNVEGIIGSDILCNSIVQISSNTHTITITDEKEKLQLNENNASKLKLNKYCNPFINITLNTVPIMVALDTGDDSFFSLSNMLMNKLKKEAKNKPFETLSTGYGANSISLFGVEKNKVKYRIRIPVLQINKGKFKNVIVETSNTIQSDIGAEILKYGIVTIDYLNKRFYFDCFENEKNMEVKKWQISPSVINDQLFVGVIWGQKKDNINLGDQIIAIDDINFEKVDICDLSSLIIKDKEKVTLTLKDKSGIIKQIEIVKE